MSKRFTDSEKFRDIWYRKLSPTMKCFWEYLLSECNNAGIIDIDFESASFHIGAEVTEADISKYDGRVIKLNDGKYFIPKFIQFQQGTLNIQNSAHKPIIECLKKYGYTIDQPFEEFIGSLQATNTPQLPPLEGGLVGGQPTISNSNSNSKGNSNGKSNNNITLTPRARESFKKPTLEEVQAYCQERKNNVDAEKWLDYYTANGWKVGKNSMKDWRAAVRTWEKGTVSAPASRKTADDDAAYWAELEKRVAENDYE